MDKKSNTAWNLEEKKKTIQRADTKNGPKGTSWSRLKNKQANAYGRAKNEESIKDATDSGIPKVRPKMKDSLISPPPKDSFLNKKLPNLPIRNMIEKEINPFNKPSKAMEISK